MIDKTFGRPGTVALAEPSPQAPHAALLVDFDNVTMGIRSDLQTQLRKLLNSAIIRGKVSVQRAYADWRRYPQYIVPLTEASIDLIFAPAVGANKKNATDIRLAIDALELVFTRPEIGTFILLSGDSDFSALVLKLKEYGKFVIGVGIRESSSDLLVQNCDEYYSYNELTGLARTGDVEIVRHDPWELVVEAVQKMLRNDDVMRSDRLKQVMQSIDPNFDEKDVGCNRFSKFVIEAEKRGLLKLTKMENGQHAVDIGPNANVPVDPNAAPATKPAKSEDTASSPRRKRPTRERSDRDSKGRALTLSESIELLKRALFAAGALGDDATVADRARERMIEIHGKDSDPIFETKRFQRLLRQAHDADAIELIKSGGEDYMLKLSAAAVSEMEGAKAVAVPEEEKAAGQQEPKEETPEDAEATAKPKKKATKRKSTTARKSTRSRARTAAKETPEDEVATSADVEEKSSSEEPEKPKRKPRRKATTVRKTARTPKAKDGSSGETDDQAAESATVEAATKAGKPVAMAAKPAAKTNPRFRKGSRSVAPKLPVTQEPEDSTETKAAHTATPTPKASTSPRSLGARTGSRGARRPTSEPKKEPAAQSESPNVSGEELQPLTQQQTPPDTPPGRNEPIETPTSPVAKPEAVKPEIVKPDLVKQEAAEKVEPSKEPATTDGAGLFRKVTAAFQRAMGTGKDDAEQ